MASTPQRMIEYLRSHDTASAIDLSAALSLTVPDIRHHLVTLLTKGWVITAGQRIENRRGRPTMLFRLGQRAYGRNLEALSSALLKVLIENNDGVPFEERLRQVALHLAGARPVRSHLSMTHRLTGTVRQMNAMGYQARWEARSGGPLIYLDHSPYGALLEKYPAEISRLDQDLLETLLGQPVKPLTSPGCSHSVFRVIP
ncbi:MAG: hypothetical protein PHQ40_05530 [Anaerolineaceae bacterium]|nr:hypothetical protein [Anaerolineaceae bacterium]